MTMWRTSDEHRIWLRGEADSLIDFFAAGALNPSGGFFDLDRHGRPLPGGPKGPVRGLHATARMVHCFTLARMLGRADCDHFIDHGMRFLHERHRDARHGGYFWRVDDQGPADATKQGYGHAFVLLAASSARLAGHPLADGMFADVSEILDRHFWDEDHGAIVEEFAADWSPIGPYRGQNSNMHLTEALMAAFEVSREPIFLERAVRIAELIIGRHARANRFRVPEHYRADWQEDRAYRGNEMFRPSGTTPGHALEWARLILQLWVLDGKRHAWMPEAAEALFATAMATGWDPIYGGLFYTLDWEDRPDKRLKLWWPLTEGIGAAAFLCEHRPSDQHEATYRKLWEMVDRHFIDREADGWHEELSEDLQPSHTIFAGKADVYHALQACLIPLFPATGSLTSVIPAK